MPSDCISYQDSGYFSPLIVDYLNEKEPLQSLYNRFPSIKNFEAQILEKQQNYTHEFRDVVADVIQDQYNNIDSSELTNQNIALLKKHNTYTITTGHQLNLFTGPLYFLYKIVSVINLCKQLKETYPDNNFVPVYWMATEDHDFEEINYFNLHHTKVQWDAESSGPVGRLSTEGLNDVSKYFNEVLGTGNNAATLKLLFTNAYIRHKNLADATRFLANELFGKEGLVIADADTASLKKLFIPYIKEELLHQTSHERVAETTEKLTAYNIQVNPREINLFYIEDNLRERIIFQDDTYYINNTDIHFSKSELLQELDTHPEKFSPNVIMRPLYQEVILPNLCYIGGGGELAYWLELQSYFKASKVTFPMLLLRNSVVIATQKQADKLDNLKLNWSDMFMNQYNLVTQRAKEYSQLTLDFSEQKTFLKEQFDKLAETATRTDVTFKGAVEAQKKKQIKGLENLEKRLLKAEKKVHKDKLERITALQNALFPSQSLQERKINFAVFYQEYGDELIKRLLEELNPLEQQFSVITL